MRIFVFAARHFHTRKPFGRAAAALVFLDAENLQAELDILNRRAPWQQAIGLKADRELSRANS